MIKITIAFFLTLLLSFSLEAGENFSEMSTQELISIMGYVKKPNIKKFRAELAVRIPTMSASEKKAYNENQKKLKK